MYDEDEKTLTERVHEILNSGNHPDYVDVAYPRYNCPYVLVYTLNGEEHCECNCSNPKTGCPIKLVRGGVHDSAGHCRDSSSSGDRSFGSLPSFVVSDSMDSTDTDVEDVPSVQRADAKHVHRYDYSVGVIPPDLV